MQNYEIEMKQKIVRLHLEEGRTIRSLSEEYSISKASISNWVRAYREECQINQEIKQDYDYMMENRKLRKELEEAKKENEFLKKAAAFFAKEIDQWFIDSLKIIRKSLVCGGYSEDQVSAPMRITTT